MIMPNKVVNLFSGPPKEKENDEVLVHDFMRERGKRIVCGGSSAQIVARILHRDIKTTLDYTDPEIPPIAKIDGIDLVTEGVLTLSRTNDLIRKFRDHTMDFSDFKDLDANNGAAMLAKMLLEDCTTLNLFIGKAINPAHQNPNLPVDLSIKLRIIKELGELLTGLGKTVNVKYY